MIDMSECKKRWKSLRDQYNKKKKDYIYYITGSARVDTSWEYRTLMSFLSDSVHDRRYEFFYFVRVKYYRTAS
ncbi:unnamed protein product [Acanthoscelides obtectus]|uniref:MADF domain-containing protein n=1 Tax=Acanthoscelides obtectus TaxID=200917 RepID=A0A9P0PQN5_ACAOB|nr:unnamed protein product [Acanthoscelides obtectus]CAK1624513.1 hypothetical protein AOBTE_LOCUS2582 [Acanthoscelides obtectus]